MSSQTRWSSIKLVEIQMLVNGSEDLYTTIGGTRKRIPGSIQCYNNNELIGSISICKDGLKAFGVYDNNNNLVSYVKSRGMTPDIKSALYVDDKCSVEVYNLPKGYSIQCVREVVPNRTNGRLELKEVTIH